MTWQLLRALEKGWKIGWGFEGEELWHERKGVLYHPYRYFHCEEGERTFWSLARIRVWAEGVR